MMILGCPSNVEDYFMADGVLAWKLHQAGFVPKYKDEDAVYFKKNAKLIKLLQKLNIDLA